MDSKLSFIQIGQDFNPEHLLGFTRVYQQAFAGSPYFEHYENDDVRKDVWEPHLKDGCIFLALQDGQVVGLSCAMPMDKWGHDDEFQGFIARNQDRLPNHPANICFMTEAAVLPEYQGKKIGTELVKWLVEWSRSLGFRHYMMRTAKIGSNSIHIFLKLGGQIMENLIQDVSEHAAKVESQSTERIYIQGVI
ncbi:MAG: GNAT family N-acetyltransferase [Candidatus Komeilibacteria bacterium]|nr:GNAT family N-acetyltransferase [Candidatus Komeilibacteria bacterium]